MKFKSGAIHLEFMQDDYFDIYWKGTEKSTFHSNRNLRSVVLCEAFLAKVIWQAIWKS